MKIIGWIREGDKAACGGTVVEGLKTCTSRGVPYTYQGAQIACRKNCVITEGFARSTLANGRSRVIHGMLTSGGCPLLSTLNDTDGVGNSGGEGVPIRFVQDDDGSWFGKMNEGYDQHFVLTDEHTGEPLPNRHYRITCKGKTIEGKTDANGKTEKVAADDPSEVTIEIMPEGHTGANK
jgi:uncharacterized Zn-binding protein involved in type VI secretion